MSRFKGDRRHKSTASRTIIIGLTACGNTKWIPINWPAFFRIPRGTRSSRIEVESRPPPTPLDGRSRVYPPTCWKYLGVLVRRLSLRSDPNVHVAGIARIAATPGPILFIPPSGVRLQNSRESSLEYGRRLDPRQRHLFMRIVKWGRVEGRGGRGGGSLSPKWSV